MILEGDLNFPDYKWDKNYENFDSDGVNQFKKVKKFMNEFFMNQIVDVYTRQDKILDVILTNNPALFSHHRTIINSVYSDHNFVISYLNVEYMKTKSEFKTSHLYDLNIHEFKIMDAEPYLWENFEELMEQRCWFADNIGALTVDSKVEVLMKTIEECVNHIFPKKPEKSSKKNMVPKCIKKLFKKKKSLSDKI